jgi:uncharacterized protein
VWRREEWVTVQRRDVEFAVEGDVTRVHDHRGFGHSDGEPRYDVEPWRQIADWRRAISYLESRPEVDPHRIGLWGTSYAGGHAIVLGATDRRVRAVVAQVPTISGYQQSLRRVAPDAIAFYHQPAPEGVWHNIVTVRSTRAARRYEPGTWISRVSPTPLMMIVGQGDAITHADVAMDAYERALQPKKLVTIVGGHFDAYLKGFDDSSGAACGWFTEHLT